MGGYLSSGRGHAASDAQPRVVLVTGCSSGLGEGLCQALHAKKNASGGPAYRVFASARRLESIQHLAEEGMQTLQLDVLKPDSITAAVDTVLRKAGCLDVLVCNAGSSAFSPIMEQDYEEFQAVMETNLGSVVRLVQAAVPNMVEQRSGAVVLIGSVSADAVTPFAGAYSASKAALRALGDALRLELAPFGVGVLWVQTGGVKSSFSKNAHQNGKELPPGSPYSPVQSSVQQRIWMSQGSHAISARRVGEQITAAMSRRKVPSCIYVGGKVLRMTCMGFVQQWLAPNVMQWYISRVFGLKRLHRKVQ